MARGIQTPIPLVCRLSEKPERLADIVVAVMDRYYRSISVKLVVWKELLSGGCTARLPKHSPTNTSTTFMDLPGAFSNPM
jgi:hypothetical protein